MSKHPSNWLRAIGPILARQVSTAFLAGALALTAAPQVHAQSWAEATAHDKGCSSDTQTRTWHVRCEMADGWWSQECKEVNFSSFKGEGVQTQYRLPDPAWAEVRTKDSSCGWSVEKQCVWNKSGFLLKVEWYPPGTTVEYDTINKTYQLTNATPLQIDEFPLGQGRCSESKDRVAVLYVVNGEVANAAIGVSVGVLSGAAAAAVCAGTAGGGCGPAAAAAVAGTSGVVTGLAALAATSVELPIGAFAVMTPGNEKYVDVWGTVYEPIAQEVGGPIR